MTSLETYNLLRKKDSAAREEAIQRLVQELRDDEKDAQQQHLKYAVDRLASGLASSNDAARQGFAGAFTELLRSFDSVGDDFVLERITAKLSMPKAANRQEQRDTMVGKTFAVLALCRSGRVCSLESSKVHELCKELIGFGERKRALRELIYATLGEVMQALSMPQLSVVLPLFDTLYKSSPSEWSPEHIMFGLQLKQVMQRNNVPFTGNFVKVKTILSRKHCHELLLPLAEALHVHPRVHSVWHRIIAELVSVLDQNDTPAWSEFWRVVVEENMMTTTPPRKLVGFFLLKQLSAHVQTPAAVSHLLTQNCIRALVYVLAHKVEPALKTAARQALEAIVAMADRSAALALAVANQLVGPSGDRNFDMKTKTRTVQHIVGKLDPTAVTMWLDALYHDFENFDATAARSDARSGEDFDAEKARQSHQIWVADQLVGVVKSARAHQSKAESPASDEGAAPYVDKALGFLLYHGHFQPQLSRPEKKSKAAKGDTATFPIPRNPPSSLSDKVRAACAVRLQSLVSDLTILELNPRLSKPVAGKETEAKRKEKGKGKQADAPDSKSEMGTQANNSFLELTVLRLHRIWSSFETQGLKLAVPLNDAEANIRATNMDDVARLRSQLIEAPTLETKKRLHAMYLLCLFLGFAQLSDRDEATELLADVHGSLTAMFEAEITKPNTKPKSKKKDATANGDARPSFVDVLVDILLAMLVKPSNLLRDIANRTFSAFTAILTEESLATLLRVLTENKASGAATEDAEDAGDALMEIDDEENELTINGSRASGDGNDDEQDDDSGSEASMSIGGSDDEMDVDLDIPEPSGELEAEFDEYDKRLAEMIKIRQEQKAQAKDLAQQTLHFRLRAVDLVESFIRNEPQSRLILQLYVPLLDAIQHSRIGPQRKPLLDRLLSLYTNRLCAAKVVANAADEAAYRAKFEELLQRASRAPDPQMVSLANAGALHLARALGGSDEQLNETHNYVLDKYTQLFDAWATTKHSHLNLKVFVSFAAKFPSLGWRMAPHVAECVHTNARNAFLKAECFSLLHEIGKNRQGRQAAEAVLPILAKQFKAAFRHALTSELATKPAHLKIVLKAATALVNSYSRMLSREQALSALGAKELSSVVMSLDQVQAESVKGVANNLLGALGVSKQQAKGKTATAAAKPGQAGKQQNGKAEAKQQASAESDVEEADAAMVDGDGSDGGEAPTTKPVKGTSKKRSSREVKGKTVPAKPKKLKSKA